MAGFMDYLRDLVKQETWKNLLYMAGGGVVGAITAGVLQRLGNVSDTTASGKIVKLLGSAVGGALTGTIVSKYLHDETGARYAFFGSIFPPIYEFIKDKIQPDQIAEKVAMGIGGAWYKGAQAAMSAPVVIEVPAAPAPAQPTTSTAPSQVVAYY